MLTKHTARHLLLAIIQILTLAIMVTPKAADCLVASSPVAPGAGFCQYSDEVYNGDVALMRRAASTRFRLMPGRYVSMVQAERGLRCTGTATVAFDGHDYTQAGKSDDPGLMELVPTISSLSGLSLTDSYDALIFTLILSGTVIGYAGFWKLNPARRMRWIGVVVFLCIAIAEARVADEYVFQIAPLIAAIPWLLYLAKRPSRVSLPLSAAVVALICSFCSIVRSGSVVICLAFLVPLFLARYRLQKPVLPVLLVLISCLPAYFFARSLVARRNASLTHVGGRALTVDSHPLWHTLYIGLGFIPNSEVPEYLDGVADRKVRSIDPTAAYTSDKYQAILRRELWSILKRRPFLVIGIIAAKAAIVTALAVILLFPARKLIFANSSLFWLDISFLSTIVMSGMNGLVAVPRASYLLTFLCLTFLYCFIKLSSRKQSPLLVSAASKQSLNFDDERSGRRSKSQV